VPPLLLLTVSPLPPQQLSTRMQDPQPILQCTAAQNCNRDDFPIESTCGQNVLRSRHRRDCCCCLRTRKLHDEREWLSRLQKWTITMGDISNTS